MKFPPVVYEDDLKLEGVNDRVQLFEIAEKLEKETKDKLKLLLDTQLEKQIYSFDRFHYERDKLIKYKERNQTWAWNSA